MAIPHGKLKRIEKPVVMCGRSTEGIDSNSLDGRKVHLFVVLAAPEGSAGLHLKMLARISRIPEDPDVRRKLLAAVMPSPFLKSSGNRKHAIEYD